MRIAFGGVRAYLHEKTGAFAIMAAVFLPAAILFIAIVIDLAMLALDRRRAQGVVDVAAIVAAQNIHVAETAARQVLALNGENAVTETEFGRLRQMEQEQAKARPRVAVVRGRYDADPDLAPEERFVAGVEPFNAARVTLRKPARFFFTPPAFRPPTIEVTAVASAEQIAAFSVGSRLAALRAGLANDLLGALLGAEVTLSALDYEALLDADIQLFQFLDALAVERGLTSGRYQDVLASEPTLADVVTALAGVTDGEGQGAASHALRRLHAGALAGAKSVELSRAIDLGPLAGLAVGEGGAQGMPATVRVLDILNASALVANGERLLSFDSELPVPPIASLEIGLVVGEAMQHSAWLRVGANGDVVTNSQIRLSIVARIPGEGALNAVAVRLPLYLEVTRAEARLAGVECPGGRADLAEVRVLARPGVADLWIGEADLSKRTNRATEVAPARLVSAPALKATGKARATVDNLEEALLAFSASDIESGVIKRVHTEDFLESALSSLGSDLELTVEAAGLGLGVGGLLKPALSGVLAQALGALDAPIASLLEILGVTIGEADIRVNGVRCDRSVLVQ